MPAVRKNRRVQLGWKLHRWLYRTTAEYQAWTSRVIPVVILAPQA